MFFRAKTAILIAVFLLLFMGGCYTKLKHPTPVIIPEEAEVIEGEDQGWDFSYGWYWSDSYSHSIHYGYYYTPWWDDCPWCLQVDLYGQDSNTMPCVQSGLLHPAVQYQSYYQEPRLR